MIDEREKCLELLGLKPGASAQEIKTAYRDLAKVWHPDRFAHDARLQEKAQNKLKEINEAYEALTSASFNHSPRPRRAADASATEHAPHVRSQHAGGKYLWPVMILVGCFVSFALYISPRLAQRNNDETGQASVTTAAQPAMDEESERDEAASNRREKKSVEKQTATAAVSSAAPAESHAPLRALPTVTVTIDPTTGLLATSACPVKSSMTYVGGQEPRQYCSADHRSTAKAEAPPDSRNKSRMKSMLNRVAAPARWLKDKAREAGEDQ